MSLRKRELREVEKIERKKDRKRKEGGWMILGKGEKGSEGNRSEGKYIKDRFEDGERERKERRDGK